MIRSVDKAKNELVDPEKVNFILELCRHYLNDYVQAVPDRVISGGWAIDSQGIRTKVSDKATRWKVQRNWLAGVVTVAGTIKRSFPRTSSIWQKADVYEKKIISRENIPESEDPDRLIDVNGTVHRLTTSAEVNDSDKFLNEAVAYLQSQLT